MISSEASVSIYSRDDGDGLVSPSCRLSVSIIHIVCTRAAREHFDSCYIDCSRTVVIYSVLRRFDGC